MNPGTRILIGTEPPGGATCLFPVVDELRRRPDLEVMLLATENAADLFRDNGTEFKDPRPRGSGAVTDRMIRNKILAFQPDMVITGVVGPTDTGLDYRILRVARELNILSLGVLDSWMNYASRFADPETGDPLGYLPDMLAVMDRQTQLELRDCGIPTDRIRVTGHPFIPHVRRQANDKQIAEQARARLGISSHERLITFFSEPLRWSVKKGLNQPIGYDEFEVFNVISKAVAKLPGQNVLLVKQHPRHSSLDLPDKLNKTPIIHDHGVPVADLLCATDTVLGMSSTLLVWAYLMGREVHVIQPNVSPENDLNMLTRRGVLPNQATAAALRDAMTLVANHNTKGRQSLRAALKWSQKTDVAVADLAVEICQEAACCV